MFCSEKNLGKRLGYLASKTHGGLGHKEHLEIYQDVQATLLEIHGSSTGENSGDFHPKKTVICYISTRGRGKHLQSATGDFCKGMTRLASFRKAQPQKARNNAGFFQNFHSYPFTVRINHSCIRKFTNPMDPSWDLNYRTNSHPADGPRNLLPRVTLKRKVSQKAAASSKVSQHLKNAGNDCLGHGVTDIMRNVIITRTRMTRLTCLGDISKSQLLYTPAN